MSNVIDETLLTYLTQSAKTTNDQGSSARERHVLNAIKSTNDAILMILVIFDSCWWWKVKCLPQTRIQKISFRFRKANDIIQKAGLLGWD